MKNVQLDHSAHKATSKKYPVCYLAHDIDVPMNVGSFFRVADALGVEKIFLTGKSIVPPNPKIKKTSRATEKYVAYEYQEDPIVVINDLKGSDVIYYVVYSSTTGAGDDEVLQHKVMGTTETAHITLHPDGSINFRIKRSKAALELAVHNGLSGYSPGPSARVKHF